MITIGTNEDDILTGTDHADSIVGYDGNDRIEGRKGNDLIWSGDGDDTVIGGGGTDSISSGDGNDRIVADGSYGVFSGGLGNDTIESAVGYAAPQVHVYAGDGNDVITLGMTTQGGNNGESDPAAAVRYSGHHVFGNSGADTFNFTNVSSSNNMIIGRIDDFAPSNGDKIEIHGHTIIDENGANLNASPFDVRIVELHGQQWILIEGRILYALEGARVAANSPQDSHGIEEVHFVEWPDNVAALPDVAFIDQMNSVPGTYDATTAIWGDGDPGSADNADTIHGTNVNDIINAGKGNDHVNGGNGNDLVAGGLDNDTLLGGKGNDQLWGGSEKDILYGGFGYDTMQGGSGDDLLYGQNEDDKLNGEQGNDTLYGDNGSDQGQGGNGKDQLYGGNGNDTLRGQRGDDTLFGGKNNDKLFGGKGSDVLQGKAGFDKLYGSYGKDKLYGGEGSDTLLGGPQNDTLTGGSQDDVLRGGKGDDKLLGNNNKDLLFGEAGSDMLNAGSGNDSLLAGAGEDTLMGGRGDDLLTGGKDGDAFQSGAGDGADIITDFQLGEDVILFDDIDFGTGSEQTDPVEFLIDNARIEGTDLVIEFSEEHSVRLLGLVDPDNSEITIADFAAILHSTTDHGGAATSGDSESSAAEITIEGLDLGNGLVIPFVDPDAELDDDGSIDDELAAGFI